MIWHLDADVTSAQLQTLAEFTCSTCSAATHHASSQCPPHNLVGPSGLYVWLDWSVLVIWIKPITDEMVPIRPTNQLGNFPAHRKPGGIQWTALLKSAMLLREERSSACICLWSGEWLQEKNTTVRFRRFSLRCNSSASRTGQLIPAATSCSLVFL